MRQSVFCFGELLLRMSPVLNRQWIHDATIPVYVGGAELNVATALAKWNIPVKYGTALPDHYLSNEIIDELKSKNIETSAILRSGSRIGTYYLPQGADLKSAGVIYDREGSSFAQLKPGMIDWHSVLKGCTWFHFSAISPALNENIAAVCEEALQVASQMGLSISVDLNYREKLWKYGKQPKDIMHSLLQYCHIIMGNIWAAESLLGIGAVINNSEGKTLAQLIDAAGKSMLQLHQRYPVARGFAYTFRLQHEYWAIFQYGSQMLVSKQFSIDQVVDKAGSGDCFMAGLIYGLYNNHSVQQVVDYASAAAVGKLAEKGDSTHQTIEMIMAKLK